MVAAVEVRRIVDGGEVDELRRRAPREGFPEHAVAPRGYPALAACDGEKGCCGPRGGRTRPRETVIEPRAGRRVTRAVLPHVAVRWGEVEGSGLCEASEGAACAALDVELVRAAERRESCGPLSRVACAKAVEEVQGLALRKVDAVVQVTKPEDVVELMQRIEVLAPEAEGVNLATRGSSGATGGISRDGARWWLTTWEKSLFRPKTSP